MTLSTQSYSAWFTSYPKTHERRGQTVEVVPRVLLDEARAEVERLREFIAGDAHHEMATIAGLLRLAGQKGDPLLTEYGDRLAAACERARETLEGATRT